MEYPKHVSQTDVRPDSFWQSELNESQWEAVRELDRPLLVIAGAGSGKTRVLTYKIAYMLERGFVPHELLALTFTNKAAREMNERIAKIVGLGKSKGLWSGTFHSIFSRILRTESEAVGFRSDFTIYDSADSRSLLKSIIKELGLDDKKYKPNNIGNRISEAKNRLILPAEYAADAQVLARDQRENVPDTHRVYKEYFQRCRRANAMDFDDLLLYTYLLFFHNEEIRMKYVQRFSYLLVDEYQDTNFAQHAIIHQLTRDRQCICVVGDDAQSIYSFRGADINNILQFHKQYADVHTVKLEQNYRSTQNIVDAANSIIFRNKGQIMKTVFSLNEKGEQIQVLAAASDKEEAAKVAGIIARLNGLESISFDDIAILYRTNAQSRSFEDALRSRNLPYRIYGGLSFYQRKEIKDLIAYFRLLGNPEDEEAFKRVVNYPTRGIGNTTLQKIFMASREHAVSLWSVAEQPSYYGLTLSKTTMGKIENFCNLILELKAKSATMSAYDIAVDVLTTTGIKSELSREDGPEGQSKRENVEELLGAIRAYEVGYFEEFGEEKAPLSGYLNEVSLLSDTDQKDDGTPKVTLMTIHAAKGLEFESVFVTGMEDGLFPSTQARLYPKEMEEERRLFYVAVTRAKRFCYLSYAQSRYRYGQLDFSEESPFIREIDEQYLSEEKESLHFQNQHIAPSLFRAIYGDEGLSNAEMSQRSGDRRKTSFKEYGRYKTDLDSYDNVEDRTLKRTFHPSQLAHPKTAARPSLPNLDKYNLQRSAVSSNRLDRKTSSMHSPKVSSVASASQGDSQVQQRSEGVKSISNLKEGVVVAHERFGIGIILAVEGRGDNAKAHVRFDSVGEKKLLLKFAKLSIVDHM